MLYFLIVGTEAYLATYENVIKLTSVLGVCENKKISLGILNQAILVYKSLTIINWQIKII